MENFTPKIDDFTRQQLAENTKSAYRHILKRWSGWAEGKEVVGNKWTQEYAKFLQELGCGNTTVNMHLTVIGKFWKYLYGKKLYYDRLKQGAPHIEILSRTDIEKLLDNTKVEMRPVVQFMIGTGARVSEVSSISKQVLTVQSEIVITGKGGKQRVLVLSNELQKLLNGIIRNGLIFGREWSIKGIQRQVRIASKRTGLKIWPHLFRHRFSVNMLEGGASLPEVKEMLGHSNIQTTMIYTHVSKKQLVKTWGRIANEYDISGLERC